MVESSDTAPSLGFAAHDHYLSWGRAHRYRHQVKRVDWLSDGFDFLTPQKRPPFSLLAFGLGRSYGDSCLNQNQGLLDVSGLGRLISFDAKTGIVRCEAGTSIEALLAFAVPRGFFVPVTPGTKHVSLGGAIANDVHGKNHHTAGTFGNHVRAFELVRSDGKHYACSRDQNADLFRATIGGLGLTGLITWVELSLKPIVSAYMDIEEIKFGSFREFLAIERDSVDWEYTVSWVDMMARGKGAQRGIFIRGRHAKEGGLLPPRALPKPLVPFEMPDFVLGPTFMKSFNLAYFHKQRRQVRARCVHYDPYFYPLDAVLGWNKAYGKSGLSQFQCVMPFEKIDAFEKILRDITESGRGSFLTVLKTFGESVSPGIMSFPRQGLTLTLDFANRGPGTARLLHDLSELVAQNGGRCYPAKDAAMTGAMFRRYYPELSEFKRYTDSHFSSSFWRRVQGDAAQASSGGVP